MAPLSSAGKSSCLHPPCWYSPHPMRLGGARRRTPFPGRCARGSAAHGEGVRLTSWRGFGTAARVAPRARRDKMAIFTILWPIPLRALLASVSRRARARGGGREAARDGAAARPVRDDTPCGHLARDAFGGGGRQL